MIIVDTNVLSEWARKAPDQKVLHWLNHHNSDLIVPSVVIAEIAFGIERVRPPERSAAVTRAFGVLLEKFSDRFLDFDVVDALQYGHLMGTSAQKGFSMSLVDGQVAALAMRHKAKLATRNVKHFKHLGIELINPWAD